jgi:hypothetical protein
MNKKIIIHPCINFEEVLSVVKNHLNGSQPIFQHSKDTVITETKDGNHHRIICLAKETSASIIFRGVTQ